MRVGTKSVLFGYHCWATHWWFVALGWWLLYGFPRDPRLWVAFFVHDLGYWAKPNLDGPEGEQHPYWGAELMERMFDGCDYWSQPWQLRLSRFCDRRWGRRPEGCSWRSFTLYHSRYLAKYNASLVSRLCYADKYATALTPRWWFLLSTTLSGELREYMALTKTLDNKYQRQLNTRNKLVWHAELIDYLLHWIAEHRDDPPLIEALNG